MSLQKNLHTQRSIIVAIAVSLGFHLIVLFFPTRSSPETPRLVTRLEASLMRRPSVSPAPLAEARSAASSAATPTLRRVDEIPLHKVPRQTPAATLHASPQTSHWTTAEKDDMNRFLRELDDQAKSGPNLAQRALAQARMIGRERSQGEREEFELVERVPGSPSLDNYSLEMYFDSLLKKLNNSAAYVRNDRRSRGLRTASVAIRIGPDGSLNSFKILNEADQQDEIAFIRSVVERALPFAAFPPDVRRSAQSVGLLICVQPARTSEAGFGFLRMADSAHC